MNLSSILLVLVSILILAPTQGWESCVDDNLCPENPEKKPLGGRDGFCPVCNTVDVLTSQDQDVVAWRATTANATAPEDCKKYGTTCICKPIGETCYSDYGALQDVWVAFSLLAMLYLVVLCGKILVEIDKKRKSKNDKTLVAAFFTGGKVSSMDKIVVLTFLGCALRLIWYIIIIPGRNATTVWGGQVLEGILLKIPQILWMGGFFFMASTWKLLAAQASSMKKSNPKAQAALDFKVNMINLFMICFLVPVYIVGIAGGVTIANLVVNMSQMLIILFLVISAPSFGFKLAKELGDGNALGKMIKQCCIQAMGCAVVMILGLVANIMGLTQNSPTATFIFWMSVHIPEIIVCHTLLLTKVKQRAKVIKNAAGSGAKTVTTATVVPDG